MQNILQVELGGSAWSLLAIGCLFVQLCGQQKGSEPRQQGYNKGDKDLSV